MKIWIVHQHAIPPSRTGFTRSYDIARHLIDLGHEVTLITSSFDHFTKQEMRQGSDSSNDLEVISGVPFFWIKSPAYSGNSIARLWGMVVFGAKVWLGEGTKSLGRPDVIIGSSPSPFAAFGAERLANRLGIPFVLEIRDLWPQTPIELGNFSKNNPVILLMGWIERHLYRVSDLIVSILPYATDHIVSKGGDPSRIIWVPNGVDFDAVPKSKPVVRGDALKVIYAGSHGLANGLDTIVEAARILQLEKTAPDVEIILYGDGPQKNHLKAQAEKYQLANIEFRDPVPKAQIWAELFKADVFLMPLKDSPLFRWGVSPNKLFDYMAAARPVIFSVSSPYNPVALSESGVTVRAGEAEELVDAIKRLSSMSAGELTEMGLRGRLYVEKHHDLRNLSMKLVDALARVARNNTDASTSDDVRI